MPYGGGLVPYGGGAGDLHLDRSMTLKVMGRSKISGEFSESGPLCPNGP